MTDEQVNFLIAVPDVEIATYCIAVACGESAFHLYPHQSEAGSWIVVSGPPKTGWIGQQFGPTYGSLQQAQQAATRSAAFAEYTRLAKRGLQRAIDDKWGEL